MPGEIKLFRDRIHGFISVPKATLLPLIGSPEFQRLRRMTQLGASSFTYPGAEHTRFQHSLGVAHLFQMMAAHFGSQGQPLDEEQALVGTCAALLHDIGHGPFSHALEGVIVPGRDHEEWTQEIVLSEETRINKHLSDLDASLPEKVAAVIGKKPQWGILVSMISSQIDVDRMDYLLRDSDCVGVQYGKFDVQRFIKMLLRKDESIVMDHRGVMNAEEYLFARYHMYWQVYLHPTTRGYECLLKAAWRRARELHTEGRLSFDGVSLPIRSAFAVTPEQIRLEQYLALDNHDVYIALKAWETCNDPILADLSNRLLVRRLLKPVVIENPISDWELSEKVKDLVKKQGYDPTYYVRFDAPSNVTYDYYTVEEGEEDEVNTKPSIMILEKSGRQREISRLAPAVQAIARQKKTRVALYVPEDCRERIEKFVS